MLDPSTFEILMDIAKLSSTEGNLYPAVATYETAHLPTLSYQAYLPGIGNKCYLEDCFVLFCFSLSMSEAEHYSLHLKTTCISISVNSLSTSCVHFSTWLLTLLLVSYRISL